MHGQSRRAGTRREPFNSTPMAVNPISPGSPHVRPMGVHRTCGEPDEIKKNTHPKKFTALCREQDKRDFVDEANLMKLFKHPNIIELLGICMQEDPLYIIVEVMANGSLKEYLRKHHRCGRAERHPPRAQRVVVVVVVCVCVCACVA